MAISKKIQKVLENTMWDSGDGQVELISAGLKYATFFVRGDWKHTHARFRWVITEAAKKLGYTCVEVESREVGNSPGDFYSAETKYRIE